MALMVAHACDPNTREFKVFLDPIVSLKPVWALEIIFIALIKKILKL